jgi:CubicO group peptidase (beta-lactamase class C family)
MKSTPALAFGSASSFGSPGAGGALGFADPATGVGYAYVTNKMGTRLAGDPRDAALREALDTRIPTPRGAAGRLVA